MPNDYKIFEHCTDDVRRIVVLAQQRARDEGCREVNAGHLLWGFVLLDDVSIKTTLGILGVTSATMENQFPLNRLGSRVGSLHLPLTIEVRIVLQGALDQMRRWGERQINTGHLFASIISPLHKNTAQSMLIELGVDLGAANLAVEVTRQIIREEADKSAAETGPSRADLERDFVMWYERQETNHARFGPNHPVTQLYKALKPE